MRKFKGTMAVEGVATSDGRVMADGALSWSTPFPFAWLQQSQHGDGIGNPGAIDMGNVTLGDRGDKGHVLCEGVIDDATDQGADFCRRMDDGTAPLGNEWGVSVDVSDTVIEFVSTDPHALDDEDDDDCDLLGSAAVLGSFSGAAALAMWKSPQAPRELWSAMTAAAGDKIGDDAVVLMPAEEQTVYMRLVSGIVRGLTACAIAAFADAKIGLEAANADGVTCPNCDAPNVKAGKPCPECGMDVPQPKGATAAGGPVKPPFAWFHEPAPVAGDERLVPQYDIETGEYLGDACPLFLSDDGQLYGHLAPANRCHIGMTECMTVAADTDVYDFSHFLIGETICEGGERLATGALAVGCDHAPLVGLSASDARDHYANVGLAWADVNVVNTPLGPWVCGAVRPDVTESLTRALRGGGISGDWRGSGLSLVAVLAVSTPGFTIQRVKAMAASAREVDVNEGRAEAIIRSNGEWAIITAPISHAVIVPAVVASAGHHGDGSCCSPCRRTALVAAGAPPWALMQWDDAARLERKVDVLASTLDVRTIGLVGSARDALAKAFGRA